MWGIQTEWVPTCLVPIESQFFLSVPGLREVKSDHQLSLVSSPSASAGMMATKTWETGHGTCPSGAAPTPQNRTPAEGYPPNWWPSAVR